HRYSSRHNLRYLAPISPASQAMSKLNEGCPRITRIDANKTRSARNHRSLILILILILIFPAHVDHVPTDSKTFQLESFASIRVIRGQLHFFPSFGGVSGVFLQLRFPTGKRMVSTMKASVLTTLVAAAGIFGALFAQAQYKSPRSYLQRNNPNAQANPGQGAAQANGGQPGASARPGQPAK